MKQVSQRLSMDTTDRLVVINTTGHQVPYQITSDGKLIFPTEVMAGSSATYTIQIGTPQEELFEQSVYGRKYPERMDDVAWENDRVAFRTYGPALQASGERAFGYDIWLKRVSGLVMEDRYQKELTQSISYHEDHGNGEIYIGVAFPDDMKEAIPVLFSEEESKSFRGGALGHVLAITDYQPDSKFTYYCGNGWSKYGFADAAAWNAYMEVFSQKVRHPLQVEVD